MSSAAAWVRRQFRDHSWVGAEERHGAFHDVILGDLIAARVIKGSDHRRRARAEHAVWDAWKDASLPVPVPHLASEVRLDEEHAGYLVERLPGTPAQEVPWRSVRAVFADLLAALRAVDVSKLALPPARTWCGGTAFPDIVSTALLPLLELRAGARVASTAVESVERMLALPASGSPCLVHGDLGPHNLLWLGADDQVGSAAGLIDLDHAAVADQVVDLAPLVGFYGSDAVREIAPAAAVEHAEIYRTTLPLQVAAAAHLRGADTLRDHALGNVVRRMSTTPS